MATITKFFTAALFFILVTIVISAVTLGLVAKLDSQMDDLESDVRAVTPTHSTTEIAMSAEAGHTISQLGPNVCVGKKPKHADAAAEDNYFSNIQCMQDNVVAVLEQAGANVTAGYTGDLDATGRVPITDPYFKQGLCPVNVHWHLGAEHLSVGQFDEHGSGPSASSGS